MAGATHSDEMFTSSLAPLAGHNGGTAAGPAPQKGGRTVAS